MKGVTKFVLGVAVLGVLYSGDVFAQKRGPVVPPVPQATIQEYCNEVLPLYQKEAALKNEVRLQVWQGNPNWDAILEKEIEAAKLRVEILKKAQEKGLPLRGVFGNIKRYCGW